MSEPTESLQWYKFVVRADGPLIQAYIQYLHCSLLDCSPGEFLLECNGHQIMVNYQVPGMCYTENYEIIILNIKCESRLEAAVIFKEFMFDCFKFNYYRGNIGSGIRMDLFSKKFGDECGYNLF